MPSQIFNTKGFIVRKQYKVETLLGRDLEKIKIPKFQRGLVWSKSTKNEFIKTLHDGFPFGSILVYPENTHDPNSKLLLLDGQQRLNTIKELSQSPLDFWIPLNKEELNLRLAEINAELISNEKINDKRLIEILSSNNIQEYLPNWTDTLSDGTRKDIIRQIIYKLNEEIRSYIDLNSLSIPLIEFTGDKRYLSKVFENLNKGGVPLNKYEIFTASWAESEINLPTSNPVADEILDTIILYYEKKIEDSAFELDNFSRDEIKQDRKITLSELAIALGNFIEKRLPSLVPQGTKNTSSELGYGVLGIACNIDNKKLDELIEKEEFINSNLPEILDKISTISTTVNDSFSTILSTPDSLSKFQTGLSTTFKTLSYFAALWNLSPTTQSYIQTMNNIRSYYLFDYFNGSWAAHGDTRLHDYYPRINQKNYLTRIDKSDFVKSFKTWLSEKNTGINFTADTTAITAIHANLTYLRNHTPDTDKLEREHIIAKVKIKNVDPNGKKIFGNSIGNCMYLIKSKNNSKKHKNFYEFLSTDDLGKPKTKKMIEESFYFSKDEFSSVEKYLSDEDFSQINELIEKRAYKVIEDIANNIST